MTNPQSLFDAMIQQLRGDATVANAFGDTWLMSLTIQANVTASNVCKFWSDEAGFIGNVELGNPVQPYLVFEENGETYEFMTPTIGEKAFIATGSAVCRIIATSRPSARSLSLQVAAALNDMDVQGVTWPGTGTIASRLMMLRMGSASFTPSPDVGPGMSSVFNRVIAFDYEYQGAI